MKKLNVVLISYLQAINAKLHYFSAIIAVIWSFVK